MGVLFCCLGDKRSVDSDVSKCYCIGAGEDKLFDKIINLTNRKEDIDNATFY